MLREGIAVVIFFEVLMVLVLLAALWFAGYVVYRLVVEERR